MREMKIALRNSKKLELLKRVQELERRGYYCVSPIQEIRSYKKVFNRCIDNHRVKTKYDYTAEYVSYVCVMKGNKSIVS